MHSWHVQRLLLLVWWKLFFRVFLCNFPVWLILLPAVHGWDCFLPILC